MQICPICGTEYDELLCLECGYDLSRDYEQFPTLAKIGPVDSVVGRKMQWEAEQKDWFCCPNCGGKTFRLRITEGAAVCTDCGKVSQTPGLGQGTLRVPAVRTAEMPKAAESQKPKICQIAATLNHAAALWTDGTVTAAGKNDDGQCDVSEWKDMVSIAVHGDSTVGLRADGVILIAGPGRKYASLSVKNFAAIGTEYYLAGVTRDGKVQFMGPVDEDIQKAVSWWRDIVAVSSGYCGMVGLKKNGTVVAAVGKHGNPAWKKAVSMWRNITQIECGIYTVGLRKDGTVVAVDNKGKKVSEVEYWTDVRCIESDVGILAIRTDGTVLYCGFDSIPHNIQGDFREDLPKWNNIVALQAVSCRNNDFDEFAVYVVGLVEDGTIIDTNSWAMRVKWHVSDLMRRND